MRMNPYRAAGLLALLCLAFFARFAVAQDAPVKSADTAFFEGLDLKEAGNCTDAIPLFQQALSLDPALHQARLYLAECAHWTGQDSLAITELEMYLQIDFAEAEHERAQALLGTCQAAIAAQPTTTEVDTPPQPAEPDKATQPDRPKDDYDSSKAYKSPRAKTALSAAPSAWSPVRVGTGVALAHYANDAKLTAAGPLFTGHFRVARFLELSVLGRVAFGPYKDHGGSVTVPQFGFGAAATIPLGKPLLGIGVVLPLVISRYDDQTLADGGILGEVALRVPVGGTRLVIGGQFEGGYLVRPVVGGSLRVEVQIGPMGEAP